MSRLYLFIVKCFYGAKIHKISAISKFIADILQIELRGWMGDAGDFGATAGGVQGIEIFLHFLAIKFGFMSITY
ncbi:MAG: hypothetical protein PUD64_02120 [Bacteroidales bacterium]|nr:hypothetical protein [Bacteroidales bacterium]